MTLEEALALLDVELSAGDWDIAMFAWAGSPLKTSSSEIVVPIFDAAGEPIGVLDVDSHREDHFDEVDRDGYESIVHLLESRWNR